MFYINPYWCYPRFYDDVDVPPTLYALMQSIVNYGKQDKVKIRDLAKNARETIFDFDYPLTSNIDKEEFEINILKHFMTRRIGFETFTSWQIELDSKLNELMPKYNILFDSISNWDLFKSGHTIEKTGEILDNKKESGEMISNTTSNIVTNSDTTMKHSDLPQSQLQELDNNSYVNIYEKNNNINNSNSSSNNQTNDLKNTDTKNNYKETIKNTQSDLAKLYIDFQNNVNSVYTSLYKELDCLFYGLV